MFKNFIASIVFTLGLALAAPGVQAAPAHPSSKLSCALMHPIAQGFLANHIAAHKTGLEQDGRTIEQFIKRLDASKLYLLETDVAEIRGDLRGFLPTLGQNCAPIEKAHQVLVKRMKEATAFAKATLEDPNFKFNDETEIVFDPNLRKFPKNKKEQEEQLLKSIQFQLSNYLAADTKLPEAKKQLVHRYEVLSKRQSELPVDELYALFLDAFAGGLDAHSSYFSPDAFEDFNISMALSLEGIGAALIWEDGYTTVDSLIPGGSAEKSGELQPKDKIIAVAQGDKPFEQVIDLPLRDVVKLIRGKKGTTVRLTILRQGSKETSHHIIALKRDKISLQDEAAKLLYTHRKVNGRDYKIAIIDLPSFYGDLTKRTRSCYEDMKKLLDQVKKDKADALVLDFSKNPGGLLTEAVRIAGLFLKKGNVVATQDAQNRLDMLSDQDQAVAYTGPMAVLTSRLSASASEIVAGALQDYHRALIIGGDHTFGKGTVQVMINLPSELGAIKVTSGMFFVPGGNSTQMRGVAADIVLPSIFSMKDIGEGSLDYSLPPKSVAPFVSVEANSNTPGEHWAPVDLSQLPKLKAASAARIEKDAEFKKIIQDVSNQEKRKGVIKLSESLKKQKEENKDEKKKLTRRGKRKSDEEYLKTPQVSEAISIVTDYISATAATPQQASSR